MYWKYFCCNISIRIAYKWHHSRISLCISQTGTTQTAGARDKGGNFIGQLCISVVPHSMLFRILYIPLSARAACWEIRFWLRYQLPFKKRVNTQIFERVYYLYSCVINIKIMSSWATFFKNHYLCILSVNL